MLDVDRNPGGCCNEEHEHEEAEPEHSEILSSLMVSTDGIRRGTERGLRRLPVYILMICYDSAHVIGRRDILPYVTLYGKDGHHQIADM